MGIRISMPASTADDDCLVRERCRTLHLLGLFSYSFLHGLVVAVAAFSPDFERRGMVLQLSD
jgi:hypothetical protein